MSRKWLLSTLILPACIILLHSLVTHHHDNEANNQVNFQYQEHNFCFQRLIKTLVNQDQGEGHCENFLASNDTIQLKKIADITSSSAGINLQFIKNDFWGLVDDEKLKSIQNTFFKEITRFIPSRAPPISVI